MQDDDATPKVAAIKEYNKLRGRIIDQSKITHVQKLDMDDIRAVISVMPQERQDQFYATITDILAEAELRRSSAQSAGGNP
jgi:GTP1/Obg family GTP-binding protein